MLSGLSEKCTTLLGLVPSILCEKTVNIDKAVELYNDDLPSPELVDQEMIRWRNKFAKVPAEERPTSCAQAIRQCDEKSYPNLYVLLKIACTLPCTSCACERSFSVIRRLRNYMRTSMGQDRLTSLGLMHIHYDMPVDLDKVVDIFASKYPRKLEFKSILFDEK